MRVHVRSVKSGPCAFGKSGERFGVMGADTRNRSAWLSASAAALLLVGCSAEGQSFNEKPAASPAGAGGNTPSTSSGGASGATGGSGHSGVTGGAGATALAGQGGVSGASGAGGTSAAGASGNGGALAGAAGKAGNGGGGSASAGTSGAGGSAGAPCDDAVWFLDSDGDTFGDPAVSVAACTKPDGYVSNSDDCYDDNGLAKPGQYFSYEDDRGDGSFDYNCVDGETPLWPNVGTCPDTSVMPVVPGTTGWWYGVVPDCGVLGNWKSNAASCPGALLEVKQKCQ